MRHLKLMPLLTQYCLQLSRLVTGNHWALALYVVPVEDIQQNVIVVEEEPGLKESYKSSVRCVWLVKDRKTEWANMFPFAAY